jgi:hypothetical protein
MLPKQKQANDLGRSRPGGHVSFGPKADIAARYEFLAVVARQPLSIEYFETRVSFFMNLYIGIVFEGSLRHSLMYVRLFGHLIFLPFISALHATVGCLMATLSASEFCCVRRHRHKRTGDDIDE